MGLKLMTKYQKITMCNLLDLETLFWLSMLKNIRKQCKIHGQGPTCITYCNTQLFMNVEGCLINLIGVQIPIHGGVVFNEHDPLWLPFCMHFVLLYAS